MEKMKSFSSEMRRKLLWPDKEEEDVTPELSATQYLRNQTQHRHLQRTPLTATSGQTYATTQEIFNLYQSHVVLKYSKYL